MLKILLLGSNLQACRCFKYLIESFKNVEIVGLVPHNGAVAVREDQDILALAKQNGISILKHEDISNLKFDLGISLLYDKVLDEKSIAIPSKGFVNFHLGPLPRFRGSNSILHAILLARKDNNWTFGVTLHYIAKKVDTGPIIDKIDMPIFEDDTALTLYNRAFDKVYDLFVRNINQLINNKEKLAAQEQIGHSYSFKKGVIDHYVDLNLSDLEIYDKVRALSFPGKPRPFAIIGDKKIYLSLEEK